MSYSQAEQIIVETLDDFLPSAAQSYRQGCRTLNLEYRGFPIEGLRRTARALRETLDYLAPDEDITNQSWFKLEPDCKGPTMKQKVVLFLAQGAGAGTARPCREISRPY